MGRLGVMLKTVYKYRRYLVLPITVIIVLCVTMILNIPALKDGYSFYDVTHSFVCKETKHKYVYTFNGGNGLYVKELTIAGKPLRSGYYTIEFTYVNDFDKEATQKMQDRLNEHFEFHCTSLKEKISSLKITIPKRLGLEIQQISFSNRFEWNPYRMLILEAILILFYLILFEPIIRNNTRLFFMVISMVFGLLLIGMIGTEHGSWDEEIHFANCYRLAEGKDVEWSEAAVEVIGYIDVNRISTRTERAELDEYMDLAGTRFSFLEQDQAFSIKNFLSYFPQILFLKIGLLLKVPFTSLYEMGKLAGLLFYVLIMSLSITLCTEKKEFLAFIAVCPTPMLQAVSYSYDMVCFSMITLGCVLLVREVSDPSDYLSYKRCIASAICIIIGCISKTVYIPLILLLILPVIRKGSRRLKRIASWILILVTAVAMLSFILPMLYQLINGNTDYGIDIRGGDTGIILQLSSMLQHPVASVKLLFSDIFRLDNFRNLGHEASGDYLITNLMLLNAGYYGVLNDKWSLLLIPLLLFLLIKGKRKAPLFSKKECKFQLLIIFVIIILIWTALYLSFTEVGEDRIMGVQARYYLPLLYPLSVLFPSDMILWNRRYGRITYLPQYGSVLFMLLTCLLILR